MKMVLNDSFYEMSQNEIIDTEGGIGIIGASAAIAGVCAALHGCYDLGVAVGKCIKNIRG